MQAKNTSIQATTIQQYFNVKTLFTFTLITKKRIITALQVLNHSSKRSILHSTNSALFVALSIRQQVHVHVPILKMADHLMINLVVIALIATSIQNTLQNIVVTNPNVIHAPDISKKDLKK